MDRSGTTNCALAMVAGLLATACQTPRPVVDPGWLRPQEPAASRSEPATPGTEPVAPADGTPEPTTAHDTHFDVVFPIAIGLTNFAPGDGQTLKNLATLAVVPTAELSIPLAREWTLVPFAGLGGGWLFDEQVGLVILTGGVRLEWEHELDEPTKLRVVPRARYNANLTRQDGLLGDWGRTDVAIELRRALGDAGDAVRFEPGVYAQGFWFWDDMEFDQPGLGEVSVTTQAELGLSAGTRRPIEILGFELPRLFLGYRFGDGVDTISIQLGSL